MDLGDVRRAYAERVCATAQVPLPGLVDAFAAVPRERFLGPGPWLVVTPATGDEGGSNGYEWTPDDNPAHVYQDVLVAIDPGRQLNNGHPSSHALWIDAAAPAPDNSVLHIGCGTGYYSAIFAELVGGVGRVLALEVDVDLAKRARDCLSPWPQVRVDTGDASRPDGPHDVIYVNAGATHARREWLDSLAEEGRLLLPLTVHMGAGPHGIGVTIVAVRRGTRWPTRVVSSVAIFDCQGARDRRAEAQIRKLLEDSTTDEIAVLETRPHAQSKECLLHVEGFCLQR
jgi:protein-L-isoaspartate(D-aspartate) O-methyltransferase